MPIYSKPFLLSNKAIRSMTHLARRTSLLLALCLPLLAACGTSDEPPTAYPPPHYDFLTKLDVNVASVNIDDSWQPKNPKADLGRLAPTRPAEALRLMAQDRLVAAGSAGNATFSVDEASIIADRGRYEGRMVVHLDVASADGSSTGYAEARVSRSTDITKETPNAVRHALHNFVDAMMADMNVEFEYQVRRSLRAFLKSMPEATVIGPVHTEPLTPPESGSSPPQE